MSGAGSEIDFLYFQLTMTQEGKETLTKAIQAKINEQFKDRTVIVDCPYANAVEYGTTPAKKQRATNDIVTDDQTGERITRARMNIREWVGIKEHLSGKDRAKAGDAIYKKVMEEGMAPHPYIRPAIEDMKHMNPDDVIAQVDAENIFDAYTICLAKKMVEHIDKNKSVASEKLKKSVKVVPKALAPNVKEYDPSEDKYNWKPGQVRR